MSAERIDSSGIGAQPKPNPSPRISAGDNSKVHPDFGSVGSATHANLHNALGKLPKGTFADYEDRLVDSALEGDLTNAKGRGQATKYATDIALGALGKKYTSNKALAGYMARGAIANAVKQDKSKKK